MKTSGKRKEKIHQTIVLVVIRDNCQLNIISWQSVVHDTDNLLKMIYEEVPANGIITFLRVQHGYSMRRTEICRWYF